MSMTLQGLMHVPTMQLCHTVTVMESLCWPLARCVTMHVGMVPLGSLGTVTPTWGRCPTAQPSMAPYPV